MSLADSSRNDGPAMGEGDTGSKTRGSLCIESRRKASLPPRPFPSSSDGAGSFVDQRTAKVPLVLQLARDYDAVSFLSRYPEHVVRTSVGAATFVSFATLMGA